MKHDETNCPTGRNVAAWFLAVAILADIPTSVMAQQFSADLVARKDQAISTLGTLHVSGQKAWIEATALPDGFFLIDAARPVAYFVRPGAHVFMDARQSSRLTQMFVPVDPDDPCRQWQAFAQLAAPLDPATWRCQRDGTDSVAGRSTDVYRVTAPSDAGFVGWIDRARRFPVQVRIADGTLIAADYIRDEPQPAHLFEIPAGIRKFDPQALIRRIQQSDVWVAPPALQ